MGACAYSLLKTHPYTRLYADGRGYNLTLPVVTDFTPLQVSGPIHSKFGAQTFYASIQYLLYI